MAPEEPTARAAFAALEEQLLGEPGVGPGTGFGKNPGLRIDGRIFAMLVDDRLVIKLPAERSAALAATGGATVFTVGRRAMREWVSVEHGGRHDWRALAREALAYVGG
jgi:hypothetical protein